MKQIKYICDKCGREITTVVYSLTCTAFDAMGDPTGRFSAEAVTQNLRQNFSGSAAAHLCRECKDKITDGVFIV